MQTQNDYMCAVCGFKGPLNVEKKAAPRDNYRCGNCRSMVRQRDVAQLFVDEFGDGMSPSLTDLLKRGKLDDLAIYEIGMTGPVWSRLKKLPNYTNSYFWEDVELGGSRDGVRCEDVRALTFDDESFDVVLSFEVFEHVFDIDQAIREIARVLRPGGCHIFSMPVPYPLPEATHVRAVMKDGEIEHLDKPHYHIAGDGSKSLVVTDFGSDFQDIHARNGLQLSIVYRSAPNVPENRNATFVARKIPVAGTSDAARSPGWSADTVPPASLPGVPTLRVKPSEVGALYTLAQDYPEGVHVVLEEGRFETDQCIYLPSNTIIEGQGRDATTIALKPRSNCHVATNADYVGGNHNILVQKLSVTAARAKQSRPEGYTALTYACGFYFKNMQRVTVQDARLSDVTQNALHFNNSRDICVRDVDSFDLGWSGLGTSGASNIHVAMTVSKAGLETTHSGIHFDGGIGIFCDSEVTDTTGNGIMIDSAYAPLSHCEVRARVSGCYRGVSLSGSADNALEHVFITGTVTDNRKAGVMVSNSDYVVMDNLVSRDNDEHGVLFQGRNGGNGGLITSTCTITGNGTDIASIHSSQNNWTNTHAATDSGLWETDGHPAVNRTAFDRFFGQSAQR